MGELLIYSFFSNQMQDCSPCAGRQGERPEFRPDRTAGKPAARAWPQGRARFKGLLLMTRVVLSSIRAMGFTLATLWAAGAFVPAAAAATKPAKAAPQPGR